MGSTFATYMTIFMIILIPVLILSGLQDSKTSNELSAVDEYLYNNEHVILSVAEKLDINEEDVILKIDDKGEPYYVTSTGTYYAEFKGDEDGELEVDYLMEVIK